MGSVPRHGRDRRELLDLATSQQSFANIVESLGNPYQQAIVQAQADSNILVLAGPGSGKTQVVVHRCAYLTRVERVPSFSILMLCFNHSTANRRHSIDFDQKFFDAMIVQATDLLTGKLEGPWNPGRSVAGTAAGGFPVHFGRRIPGH